MHFNVIFCWIPFLCTHLQERLCTFLITLCMLLYPATTAASLYFEDKPYPRALAQISLLRCWFVFPAAHSMHPPGQLRDASICSCKPDPSLHSLSWTMTFYCFSLQSQKLWHYLWCLPHLHWVNSTYHQSPQFYHWNFSKSITFYKSPYPYLRSSLHCLL